MLRKLLGGVGTALGILLITALMLEVALRVANALGIITPAERVTENVSFYRDENRAFGVWHPPNASFHAKADCFDVVYESNSVGARDVEREERSSASRTVVLGDSFVEGIGVELSDRMSGLLEAWSGVEHLNFGTAGNFSSIQQWKLYETLASRFDHDRVLLFAFPNNDFFENDYEAFWQNHRYRPYLRESDDGFEVYYPVDYDAAQQAAQDQLWWNRWYNRIFLYRLVAFVDGQVRVRLAQGGTGEYGYQGYSQYTDEDLERLFFSYRKIRDLAAGRPLVIYTIPRITDLMYAQDQGSIGTLPERLARFAAEEEGIAYHDLAPGYLADAAAEGRELGDYFLPCDGHWSVLGNQVAAEIVRESLR